MNENTNDLTFDFTPIVNITTLSSIRRVALKSCNIRILAFDKNGVYVGGLATVWLPAVSYRQGRHI